MGTFSRFILGICLSIASASAFAAFPSAPGSDPWENRPNDPSYLGAWMLFSHIPAGHVGTISDFERKLGAGISADKAWQFHIGTPDTLIAVLDSGIYWENDDLLERFYLNRAELPLPQGSQVYDKNGDGRFSVSDYAGDTRVKDSNGNGKLDPGDLIAAFSNGVDEDGNGFVDDICGWDFHEHDNDAFDRTRFGHGTGEAMDSGAAINNGIGQAGVCGNCSIVPLRVNDSFVVDVNAFAAAVHYASTIGVSIIQEALGSVNHNTFTRWAIEEAYNKGITIIGSAADENSFHHNYPATLDPIVYTNAIRYDTREVKDATTFVNFNNCSNYGARVDVAVSAMACSSEATGIMSGVAALASSYARSLKSPLKPGELISLIKNQATDIALGTAPADSFRWSSYPGWDNLYGYGRANAFQMLSALHDQKIPPEARITSPEWFDVFTPGTTKSISVGILASAPRAESYSVRLELLKGTETSESVPRVIKKEIKGLKGETRNIFADIPVEDFTSVKDAGLDAERDKYAYTLRLVVEDSNGLKAESRRTLFVFDDPDLLPGYPVKLAGSGESSGLFIDLLGDKKQAYVAGDGSGFIHAFTTNGKELPGFPVATVASRYEVKGKAHTDSSIIAPVAAGDILGDGHNEIVAVSLEGDLSVVKADGSPLPGFPIALPVLDKTTASHEQILGQGVYAAPVLVDLDGDKKLEIVVVALDGLIHVYRFDGTVQPGFPFPLEVNGRRAKLLSSPAIIDIDRDGTPDLVLGSNHAADEAGFLFAVNGRGRNATNAIFPGFPAKVPLLRDAFLPTVGTGIPTAPAIADLDNDGEEEIIIHAFVGKIVVIGRDGKQKKALSIRVSPTTNTNDTHMMPGFGHPAVGDLLGNGQLNPVTVGVGRKMLSAIAMMGKRFDFDHMLGAWDYKSGEMLSSFPRRIEDMALSPSPVLSDLDGSGRQAIIVGSSGYVLHAFTQSGEAKGFPHFTGGWMYATPSVGDLEGNGHAQVAVTTREGYLFIWRTDGMTSPSLSWSTFKANPQRTGHLLKGK